MAAAFLTPPLRGRDNGAVVPFDLGAPPPTPEGKCSCSCASAVATDVGIAKRMAGRYTPAPRLADHALLALPTRPSTAPPIFSAVSRGKPKSPRNKNRKSPNIFLRSTPPSLRYTPPAAAPAPSFAVPLFEEPEDALPQFEERFVHATAQIRTPHARRSRENLGGDGQMPQRTTCIAPERAFVMAERRDANAPRPTLDLGAPPSSCARSIRRAVASRPFFSACSRPLSPVACFFCRGRRRAKPADERVAPGALAPAHSDWHAQRLVRRFCAALFVFNAWCGVVWRASAGAIVRSVPVGAVRVSQVSGCPCHLMRASLW